MLSKAKIMMMAVAFFGIASVSNAYTIGGAYARLLSCKWGQMGYEHGYIGTYEANGAIYQIFFGTDYCEY